MFDRQDFNRRGFLRAAVGTGVIGLHQGIHGIGTGWADEGAAVPSPSPLHHPGKVKSVIFYFCSGGPAQGYTFDPPKKKIETDVAPFEFIRAGKSGLAMTDIFPRLATVADELCVLRSGYGAAASHADAGKRILTASSSARASLGSWLVHGLGTGNPSLPSYVILGGLVSGDKFSQRAGYIPGTPAATASGGLPSSLEGLHIPDLADPIANIVPRYTPQQQDFWLERLRQLNAATGRTAEGDFATREQSFQVARRMQSAAPAAFDIGKDVADSRNRKLYGLDEQASMTVGTKCLLARKLVENGVRFIMIPCPIVKFDGGVCSWDTHKIDQTVKGIPNVAASCDWPLTGLITDLKQRGLLDSTLIVWGGEMGRGGANFQNHNGNAFCWWFAGGGVKGGTAYGATDETGKTSVEKPVHVRDLHATILWMAGLDCTKLEYKGKKLDASCKVIKDIIA